MHLCLTNHLVSNIEFFLEFFYLFIIICIFIFQGRGRNECIQGRRSKSYLTSMTVFMCDDT